MKSISAICAGIMVLSNYAYAQSADTIEVHSFKSRHGHEDLPQKGDWALGISATGFLNYFGNLMNNSAINQAPAFTTANTPNAFAIGNLGGMAVMGKYMKTSTLAYRVRFQANAGNTSFTNNVLKSSPTPDPLNPTFVEDKMSVNSYVVLLGAGFEKRRGTGRLQGFYGAEALVGLNGSKRTYTYGNVFTADFTAPVSTSDFANSTSTNQSIRTKENFSGNSFLLGARGFVGVEYFFAPKISLGGEIGYTLGFSTNGKGYTTVEQWNSGPMNTATVTEPHIANSGLMSWGIGLDNINAGINLHFYF